jgi:hypothetical protein
MSQTPTVGRIVLAVGFKAQANGTDVAPAIITRVWSQRDDGAWCVNAKLFRDASSCEDVTSAYLFDDEEAARSNNESHETTTSLHWPARV